MSVRFCHQSKLYLRFESAIFPANVGLCSVCCHSFMCIYLSFGVDVFGSSDNTIIIEGVIVKSFHERFKLDLKLPVSMS